MKRILCIFFLCTSFTCAGQQFSINKGMDSIFVGEKDTTVSVSFKLKDISMDINPKLTIKINSGNAIPGIDYSLLDAYNSKVSQIDISNVENKSGAFKIKVSGDIKTAKTINLQIIISDNGKTVLDIARIILAPPAAKAKEEIKKPAAETKNDSLVIINQHNINIAIYDTSHKPYREGEKKRLKKESPPVTINVFDIKIVQNQKLNYYIEVTTTGNDIYLAHLEITNDYKFKDDDKLYLDGDNGKRYLKTKELFRLYFLKAGEVYKSISDDKVFKFKL